jgi:hypothetical protein
MNAHLRMIGRKVVDEFGLTGRKIVSDVMDLASEGLGGPHVGKKVDELGAGMALSSLAKDFSASSIKGRVKRKGSVAVILKTMGLESPGDRWPVRARAARSLADLGIATGWRILTSVFCATSLFSSKRGKFAHDLHRTSLSCSGGRLPVAGVR